MAETVNYNLFLADDSTMPFRRWREEINGVSNSNMIKIDEALSQKAGKSVSVNMTLLADEWIGESSPFTQELTILGLTAEQNGTIAVAQSATPEQREAARNAVLTITEQSEDRLIIAADGECPAVDIPVFLLLIN